MLNNAFQFIIYVDEIVALATMKQNPMVEKVILDNNTGIFNITYRYVVGIDPTGYLQPGNQGDSIVSPILFQQGINNVNN